MVAKDPNVNTNQNNSFVNDSKGNVARNTVIAGGELKLIGMNTAIKITNTSIGDTATALPVTPLSGRNSMIIYNTGATPLFIGDSGVSVNGVNEGWIIDAGSFFSVDITSDVSLYGLCETSLTLQVKIMEMA